YVLFFFSSRRRHTRSYGDWSSDVCSSDLGPKDHVVDRRENRRVHPDADREGEHGDGSEGGIPAKLPRAVAEVLRKVGQPPEATRSEERRVGKGGGERREDATETGKR